MTNAGKLPDGMTARLEGYLETMGAYDKLPDVLRKILANAPLGFSSTQVLHQWRLAESQGVPVHRVAADLRRAIKRTMETAAEADGSNTRH